MTTAVATVADRRNDYTRDNIPASEKRRLTSLDGLWNFRAVNQSKQNQGFDEQWFKRPLKQVRAHLFNFNISDRLLNLIIEPSLERQH